MAFSVLVGNMIGAKRFREAREYAKLGVMTGVVWGAICCMVLMVFKYHITTFFSRSE